VSKGGKNDILNLITSCYDCNRGKGKHLLKDNETLKKQKEQLNQLQKKREQIEMLVQWKNELYDVENYFANNIAAMYRRNTFNTLSIKAISIIKKAIDKTAYETVFDTFNYIMSENNNYDKMDGEDLAKLILKTSTFNKHLKDNPYMKDVFYLRKILINRFKINKKDFKTLTLLKDRLTNAFRSLYNKDEYNMLFEKCKELYKTSDCLQECYDILEDYDEEINNG
jgi:hypothetical protein